MSIRKQLILSIICLLGCNVYAQVDINSIKNDKENYYSAEGAGVTQSEAYSDAMGQISRSIMSVVYDSFKESESYNASSGEFAGSLETFMESYSSVSLSNVNQVVISPEPEAKVFCYVSKEDVAKAFQKRVDKILDFVKSAQLAEKSLQIDDALRYYYWTIILASTHTDIIKLEDEGNVNVITYAELKIKNILSHIRTKVNSCEEIDNRFYTNVTFQYQDYNVASLQLRYFDGSSYVGPLAVRDGIGELELVSIPNDKKVGITYEYMFINEANSIDDDLKGAFASFKNRKKAIIFKEAKSQISLNGKNIVASNIQEAPSANGIAVAAEDIVMKRKIDMKVVDSDKDYRKIMKAVEEAIKKKDSKLAYEHFTTEGYKMFNTLVHKTGKLSLVGKKQEYTFVETPERVLARFCKVSLKFNNGKKFMENLVFRFNKEGKIESVAFALTDKAERDIMNADATLWKEVSRFAILQFMEDYQTAYALRRLDYIDQIFSDEAIIVVGSVLQKAKEANIEGQRIDLGQNENVVLKQQTKAQYLSNLERLFDSQEYINLTFENNQIQLVNAPHREIGTIFAIQIRQLYNSSSYSDQGYLTLVFDASRELPLIGVRLWQPEEVEMIKIHDFVKKFKF